MDSGKRHDDEVDFFEPSDAQTGSVSSAGHIETETNVFSVDALRRASAQHGGTDTGSFEVSAPQRKPADGAVGVAGFEPPAPKPSAVAAAGGAFDDIDDDFPPKKVGFFARLFRAGGRGEEDDLDELSLDDDMFIAPPPPAHGRSAGNSGAAPVSVATATEVTDSGVFELGPSTGAPVAEAGGEPTSSVSTVTEVTDSGVFELEPSAPAPVADAGGEPASFINTVTEVTDSGVFEIEPSAPAAPVAEVGAEPASSVSTVTEVTDSGVFEIEPSAAAAPVAEAGDEPAPSINTVTEVTDSGIFELAPAAAPPPHHGAHKDGDEWEIGWEPEDDGAAAAEFDVSGAAAPSADAGAGAEAPPPVFTRFAHVCLYVKDLGRSVEFYGKLGFKKRFVFNRNGNLFGAYLEFGDGNFIELFEDVSRGSVAALGRLAHFCLETPDIDAAMESLSARGIGFSPKKLGCDSTYQIWLKDPDGNEFEIHQYTPDSSQIVGGEVEADW